jgi:SAM-dependent methyltransferase
MNPAEFANIARSEQQFWWYRGMNLILFRLLDRIARERGFERVLEGGCGTGYLAKLLVERYGWRVFPVDLGWEGLEFAQSMGVGRLSQADISQLPYASDSFDAVLSMDVIVHFPRGEEHRAFEELTRVLKPGGLFAVRVSALDMLRSRHSQFAHERQRFSRSRLLAAARDCGIQVERCTYANSLLMPIALAKFRVWEPLVAPEPASGVTPVNTALDNALYSALRFEAGWLGAGLNLPVGQSLILIGWKQ